MMTGKDGKYFPPKAWARERVVTKVFDILIGWFFLSFVGGSLWFISEGFRIQVEDIWHSPQSIREAVEVGRANSDRLDSLARRVSILSQPDVIFEVSPRNSGPVDGFCVEQEPCRMRIRVRRVEAALSCQIVPGAVWGFINPATDTFTAARRLDSTSPRDLGASWEFIELEILTPVGLKPQSDFVFESSYVGCPGMEPDDAPISRRSDRIPIRVLDGPCRFKISASGIIHGPDSPHWSQASTERCFPTRAEAEAALE
jgi:hypothetical protein